jgi:HTH-type transcriptional regulator/antitoxin HigA
MQSLPYKIIKSKHQYYAYCNELEELVILKKKNRNQKDAIELLTLLIEKWDEAHSSLADQNPVEILGYLMAENKLKSIELARTLQISPSLVSDILNYRRGLSKKIIRKLSDYFKVSQELFNRPYSLISPLNAHLKDASASVMNTPKKVVARQNQAS